MDTLQIHKIKLLTIAALMADDILMGILVLKGGNALGLAYDITDRGSIDIDFSMETDFTPDERRRILNQITSLLEKEFAEAGLFVFDVKFSDKPNKINDAVKSFWGGYLLEFKVISMDEYDINKEKGIEYLRRNAIPIHDDLSTKFTVDISKHEYVEGKRKKDIDGIIVNVYSPEMLAIEKLRALCQQVSEYREIVFSMTPKSRARDFYDIHNLYTSFNLDFRTSENIELCHHIFEAKKVPIEFIRELEKYRDFHKNSWQSVIDTVSNTEELEDFDFYFDFCLRVFAHLN